MRTKVLSYSAVFTPEKEGGFSVSFPDFPEAHSQGDNLEDAFRMAINCLNGAIEWRLEEKAEIPGPGRRRRGQYAIPVSLGLAPKLALYQTMRDRRVSNDMSGTHIKSLVEIAWDDLQSETCGHCGQKKRKKQSFCRRCYFALPIGLRNRLYKSFSEGYAQIYDEAKTYLQCETDIPRRKDGAS